MNFFFTDPSEPAKLRNLTEIYEREMNARLAYEQHLERLKHRFPEETGRFLFSPWYHDPRSHLCPHDGRLERLDLTAGSTGLNLTISIRGAYGDETLRFSYVGVTFLHLASQRCPGKTDLGDWLVDEFDIDPAGNVVHEIRWERGAWKIVAATVALSSSGQAATGSA